jgi:hypothetical protein
MKKIFLSVVTAISVTMVSQAQFKSWFTKQAEDMSIESYKRDIEIMQPDTTGTRMYNELRDDKNSVQLVTRRKRVAVMPLIYLGNDHESRLDEMRFYLQDITIDFLNTSTVEMKILDAAEINALLRRKGIDAFDHRAYTPEELAKVLNVEYVIMGTVLQDLGREVTTFNGYSNRRERVERRGKDTRMRGRDHHAGSSVTRQNIETRVSLSIYDHSGYKIYSGSRRSLLSGPGAYRNTIHYMLKRSPLYNR